MILNEFKNKKILIYGLGLEGISSIKYLTQNKFECEIEIFDDNKENLEKVSNEYQLAIGSLKKNYDLILKSPGVIIKAEYSDLKYSSQTEIIFKYFAKNIIGITATKGKSTTTALIFDLLKHKYQNVFLVGNIGKPAFDYLDSYNDESIIVYELSCHQLDKLKYSPHIALYLNIYEEHLDRYLTFTNYKKAKDNIYLHQNKNDYLLVNKQVDLTKTIANTISYPYDFKFDNDYFYFHNSKLKYDRNKIKLLGDHNLQNMAFLYVIKELFKISDEDFLDCIYNFKALSHRLELVYHYQDLKFYDDSISTSADSTINAINTIKDLSCVIIGGLDRGIDYSKLIKKLKTMDPKKIVLIYESGRRIKEELSEVLYFDNLFLALDYILENYNKGSILLSPASASYDHFKNFADRGDKFKAYIVEKISTKMH